MSFYGKADLSVAAAQNGYVQGLPTRRAIKSDIDKWQGFINANGLMPTPDSFTTGKASADWTVAALETYGRKVGGVDVPGYIKDGISGAASTVDFALSNPTTGQWLSRGAQMGSVALAGMTSPQVAGYTTATISAGAVVVDAFKDGDVSAEELGPMLQSAGATGGAIIGSIIPGIGTLVGSAVGAALGALAGMLGSSAMLRAQVKAHNEKMSAEVYAWAKDECKKMISGMNKTMAEQIGALSVEWLKQEARLGYRYDLRWFDPNPGLAFEAKAYPSGVRRTDGESNGQYGRYSDSSCIDRVAHMTGQHTSVPFQWSEIDYTTDCNFYCPNPEIGCKYPPSPLNQYSEYGASRIINALAARGFSFPLPACVIPTKEPYASTVEGYAERYAKETKDGLQNTADYHAARFDIAKKIVTFDLTRTTAVVEAATAIYKDQWALQKSGTSGVFAVKAAASLAEHQKRMKSIALVGGGGLLAAAILGALK